MQAVKKIPNQTTISSSYLFILNYHLLFQNSNFCCRGFHWDKQDPAISVQNSQNNIKTNSLRGSNHKPSGKYVFVLKLNRDMPVFSFSLSPYRVEWSTTNTAQRVSLNSLTSLYFPQVLQPGTLNLRSYYIILIALSWAKDVIQIIIIFHSN